MKKIIIYIFFPILLNIIGEIYLKQSLNQIQNHHNTFRFMLEAFQSLDVVLGSLFIFLSSLLWIKALSRYQLSYLYPFMSLNYVGILVGSKIILKEPLLLKHYLATLCICIGLYFISKSKKDTINSSEKACFKEPKSSIKKKLKVFFVSILACIFIGLSACQSVNPNTGKKTFNTVSERQEKEIGQKVFEQTLQKEGLFDDPLLQNYVSSIGEKMVSNIEQARFEYRFTITQQSMINAFAAPGGYIFITRGILAAFNTEDELASVIGHEITHITGKHTAQRISQQQLSNIFSVGLLLATQEKNVARAGNIIGSAFMSGYGRENELESDHFGLKLANKSGYDPDGALRFMTSLKRFSGDPPSDLSQLFASHPKPSLRIEKINSSLSKLEKRVQNPHSIDKQRSDYFKKIEGILVGQWPLYGGILKSNYQKTYINPYYHIKIPEGDWLMSVRNQQPFLELKHRFRYSSAKLYFQSERNRKQNPIFSHLKEKPFSYLQLPFAKAKIYNSDEGLSSKIYIRFTKNKIDYFFVFKGVRSHLLKDAKKLFDTLQFRSPQASLLIGAAPLEIYKTRPKDTYESISKKFYNNKKNAKDLAFFNGQNPAEKPYQLIKRWVPTVSQEAIYSY